MADDFSVIMLTFVQTRTVFNNTHFLKKMLLLKIIKIKKAELAYKLAVSFYA